MNNLELIKTNVNENNEVIVSGRELHEFLEISTPYTMWIGRMIDYGFEENEDYILLNNFVNQDSWGGHNKIDHVLKLDMAKEISMIQRSEKGKAARLYFLSIEKLWNTPEKVMERALQFARQRVEEQERIIFEQKPKVLLAESIGNSNDLIGVGELSKIIKQNGYDIGEKRLFKWLRDNKYIMYRNKQNVPTQYSMDRGLLKITERTITNGDSVKICMTTKVTGKGQQFFVNKFLLAAKNE